MNIPINKRLNNKDPADCMWGGGWVRQPTASDVVDERGRTSMLWMTNSKLRSERKAEHNKDGSINNGVACS